MAIAIKNIVVGPGTVSLGGADLGAIKKGTLELTADQEQVMIGDNENLAGYCYLTFFKKRQAYNRTAEVTLYLIPEFCNKRPKKT